MTINKVNSKLIIIAALALVVGAGAGFFGGMKYQQGKIQNTRFGNFQTMGARNGSGTGRAGNGNNFRPVSGDIISADEKSITVKMPDGTSRIVLFSNSTTINKSAEGSKSDLTVGQKVAVFGMQNSDGSVTAENIQLNPMLRTAASPMPQQ